MRALLLLLALAGSALAAPKIIDVDIDRAQLGFRMWQSPLPQATDEPGGLQVPASPDAAYLAVGLQSGDVIRALNGSPVGDTLRLIEGVYLLDIVRAGKPLLLRVTVRGPATRNVTVTEADYLHIMDRAANGPLSTPLRANGRPSGVRIVDSLLSLYTQLDAGDVLRTINGAAIHDETQLVAALKSLPVGHTDIVVERLKQTIHIDLVREAPLDFTQVKHRGNAYELPAAIADAIRSDPDVLGRDSKALPDPKRHALVLFEVGPGSPAALLGLQTDDVVLDVDGHTVEDSLAAMHVASTLQGAATATLHLERAGKRIALTYVVR